MLVKLTPTVNFINSIRTNFSYEFFVRTSFRQLFPMYVRTYVGKKSCRKDICTKNSYVKTLMKLTPALASVKLSSMICARFVR